MKAAFGAVLQRKVKNINSHCVDLAETCKRRREKLKNFIIRLSSVFFFFLINLVCGWTGLDKRLLHFSDFRVEIR